MKRVRPPQNDGRHATQAAADQGTSHEQHILKWRNLSEAARVTLTTKHEGKITGVVDQVTPDGSVIWVFVVGGLGRRMFHESEVSATTALTVSSVEPART